jgi:hypothetical protein
MNEALAGLDAEPEGHRRPLSGAMPQGGQQPAVKRQ